MKISDSSCKFVSIIILNYNGGDVIVDCIRSVLKTKNVSFEIILIDNNSSDNSENKCDMLDPRIKLIKNKENIGLTARNLGIDSAKGEFIVFLDSDTIVQENWLKNLIISYEKNGDGLYQPKFLELDNRKIISSAGNMINLFGFAYSIGRGEEDYGQYEKFKKIGYAPGACTFASIDTIKKIGKIEPMFFAYHDDLDYGWRAQLLDIPSYYEPTSIVYHYVSHTLSWNSKKFFLLERNRWICLLTLYSRKTLYKILPMLILLEFGISFYFLVKGMGGTKIKSLFGIIKLNKEIKERKKTLQQTRKISDKEIVTNFVDDFLLSTSRKNNNSLLISNIITKLSKMARNRLK